MNGNDEKEDEMEVVMRKLAWSVALCAMTWICLWVAPAHAAESVGEIAAARGTVMVLRDGRVLTGKKGLRLREGDIVQTAYESTARLRMDGGDHVFVAYRSRVRISEYGRSGTGFAARFRAFFGRLWFHVKKNVMSRYEVRTPTAVLGVRGTSWAMDVSKLKTQVAGFSGLVHVSGAGKGVDVGAGWFVSAGVNGPGKARPTPAGFLRKLVLGGIPERLIRMTNGAASGGANADYVLRAPAEHLAVDLKPGANAASVAFMGWYCAPRPENGNPLAADLARLYKDVWAMTGDGSSAPAVGRKAASRWRDLHLGANGRWPFDRMKEGFVRTGMNAPVGRSRVYQQGPCYTGGELRQIRAAVSRWLDAIVRGAALRGRGLDAEIARFAGVR